VGCTLQILFLLADAITYQYFFITSWLRDLGYDPHLNTYSRSFGVRASSTDLPIKVTFHTNLAEGERRTTPNTGRWCINVLQYYDDTSRRI
jgi:hypothetical protein